MHIAIQSKRKLPFDLVSRVEGIIKVEINLYQRTENGWYLRLMDTCTYEEKVKIQVPNPENPEEKNRANHYGRKNPKCYSGKRISSRVLEPISYGNQCQKFDSK